MTPKTDGGFVKLDRELVRGEIFTALSSKATRLLIAIHDQYNGRNNGAIRYSIAQAMRWLHCSKSTAIRTFAELRKAGLIEITEKGSFAHKNGARKGTATAWKLTYLKSATTPS